MVINDMTVMEKISWAEEIYSEFGHVFLEDSIVKELIDILRDDIECTHRWMENYGTLKVCKKCGMKYGSCCSERIDNLFDKKTLLVNLLMGVELPGKREIENGCFFQGEKGCKLMAREIICIDTFCDEILNSMGKEKFIEFKNVSGEEHTTLFRLEDRINILLVELGLSF